MTYHVAIGVSVFTLPIVFLLVSFTAFGLFESGPKDAFKGMQSNGSYFYIYMGSVSFIVSVLTFINLITKFVRQPEAHGYFAYADTFAR